MPLLKLGVHRLPPSAQAKPSQAKALRYALFAVRELARRIRKLLTADGSLAIREVAVIGSGTMGTGIVICLANAGINVRLIDVQDAALQ